jgi:hypothetical protein
MHFYPASEIAAPVGHGGTAKVNTVEHEHEREHEYEQKVLETPNIER